MDRRDAFVNGPAYRNSLHEPLAGEVKALPSGWRAIGEERSDLRRRQKPSEIGESIAGTGRTCIIRAES